MNNFSKVKYIQTSPTKSKEKTTEKYKTEDKPKENRAGTHQLNQILFNVFI